ncbi:MFS transporter [Komagataeibacter oboediens]|uniref:MFS transporter n=1 Tax=Komagataeibacter oboediens TaxID=65958 RepID=UPI0020C520C4|nr:MFS transporter [Komagataeibacter oboediens]
MARPLPEMGSSVPGRWLVICACVIGSVIEYYDFVIYAYFSGSIAQTFFPTGLAFSPLALVLATFGLTMVGRPLGAVVLGTYADRRGRLPTMILCIRLMTLGSLLLALTPGYDTIGVLAPVAIVGARLLHGFSLGGEFSSATSCLIENSPHHEARAASWQPIGQILASFLAAAMALALSVVLPPAAFDGYGFRIATLGGICAGMAGLVLRRRLLSLPSPAGPVVAAPFVEPGTIIRILLVAGMISLGSGITYLGIYMPYYARHHFHIETRTVYVVSLTTYAVQLVFTPLRWKLASYFDRTHDIRPPALGCVIMMILPWLAFSVLHRHSYALLAMPLVFNMAALMYFAVLDGFISLLFPRGSRGRGLAIGYSSGVVVFGSLAPLVNAALIAHTGLESIPMLYVSALAVLALVSLLLAAGLLRRARPA